MGFQLSVSCEAVWRQKRWYIMSCAQCGLKPRSWWVLINKLTRSIQVLIFLLSVSLLRISIDRLDRSLLEISAWTGWQCKSLRQCLSWIVIPQAALQRLLCSIYSNRLTPPRSSCSPPLVCINGICMKNRLSSLTYRQHLRYAISGVCVCVRVRSGEHYRINFRLILKSQPNEPWGGAFSGP